MVDVETRTPQVAEARSRMDFAVGRERQLAREQVASARGDAESAAARLARVKQLADDAVDTAWQVLWDTPSPLRRSTTLSLHSPLQPPTTFTRFTEFN
jgi:hypothetical protein